MVSEFFESGDVFASTLSIARLRTEGFVVLPAFTGMSDLVRLNSAARVQLNEARGRLELEADLQYPGAPHSRSGVGGGTIRRLLDANARDPSFCQAATALPVRRWMEEYFGADVYMSRAHHNCLMTKHPEFGSLTGWHRDARYWSFTRPDLVSVWLALGEERVENGALWFVPGSHRIEFAAERFDGAQFFRSDLQDNQDLLSTAVSPVLQPGDAVFFHCNTLHSAGKNLTDSVKLSLVFTYHGAGNSPVPGTRSAAKSELALS
jgi:phytanoyl-CoA hydroxylase